MNQEHNLDNVFKNKLGSLSVDPPEYIWSSIEQRISKKKKKKGVAWWIFASLILLTVSGAIYVFNQGSNNTDKLLLTADQDKNEKENLATSESITPEEQESKISIENEAKSSSSESIIVAKEVNKTESYIKETKTGSREIKSIKGNNQKSLKGLQAPIQKESSLMYLKEEAKIEINESVSVPNIPRINKEEKLSIRLTIGNLSNLNSLVGLVASDAINPFKISRKFIQKNTECYSFGKNGGGNGLYLEAFISPEYGIKSLSTKTDGSTGVYLEERKNTESVRLGFSGGLRVGFKINNQLGIKTGVMYSVLNEKFDYVNEMEERITITYIRDGAGMIIDSSITRELGTRFKTTYNKYHFLDIPILLTYRVENKDISFTASAGPMINMAFWQKGDIIEPLSTLRPMSITSGDATVPVFKNNVGISLYAGLSINYSLGESKEFFFEPHVRHILRPVTLDVYPLDQKYTTVGASIGIRLKFN